MQRVSKLVILSLMIISLNKGYSQEADTIIITRKIIKSNYLDVIQSAKIIEVTKPSDRDFATATIEFVGVIEEGIDDITDLAVDLEPKLEQNDPKKKNVSIQDYKFTITSIDNYINDKNSAIPDISFGTGSSPAPFTFKFRYKFQGWPLVNGKPYALGKEFKIRFGKLKGEVDAPTVKFILFYKGKKDKWTITKK